jgi:hypothetical protein
VPPPGPLIAFLEHYRIAMTAACLLMTAIVRFGIVGIVHAVCRRLHLPGWPHGGVHEKLDKQH